MTFETLSRIQVPFELSHLDVDPDDGRAVLRPRCVPRRSQQLLVHEDTAVANARTSERIAALGRFHVATVLGGLHERGIERGLHSHLGTFSSLRAIEIRGSRVGGGLGRYRDQPAEDLPARHPAVDLSRLVRTNTRLIPGADIGGNRGFKWSVGPELARSRAALPRCRANAPSRPHATDRTGPVV